jgi:hypothetical protein
LEALGTESEIDSGAEEELFRRIGQEAAKDALVKRWQEADGVVEIECGSCGRKAKKLGVRERRMQSLCGPMKIQRQVYYCENCQRTEIPLDERLGIGECGMTPGLMRVVCRTALELAYEQSHKLLSDTLGFTPCSAREVERIAKEHGGKIESLMNEHGLLEIVARPVKRWRKARYCMAIDGVMIAGLPDPETHRLAWHDVKVGVLFDSRGLDSTTYVAGRESVEPFGERLWKHIQGQGLDEKDFRVVLGDGAPWIWNLADMHLPTVPQLLDLYHAAEHLSHTAKAVWPEKTANNWWHCRVVQLKEGRLDNFFASLKWLARSNHSKNYRGEENHSPQRLLRYFLENKSRLNYLWASEQHLPIGSGVVESAARHIVQQRLKQSGMRWSDSGAQAILNLRTIHRSNQFEQYWEGLSVSNR